MEPRWNIANRANWRCDTEDCTLWRHNNLITVQAVTRGSRKKFAQKHGCSDFNSEGKGDSNAIVSTIVIGRMKLTQQKRIIKQ